MSTLDQANRTADRAIESVDKTIDNMDARVDRAKAMMDKEATRVVRGMLLTNYSRSGITTRTGKLRSALGKVEAIVKLEGKKPKIIIMMPSNIGNYDNGSNFYEAAASVNYGSVRGGKEKNKKRRRKIKKKVQKNAGRKKPKDSLIVEGHLLSTGKQTKAGSTISGGTTVTKAYDYWT